MLRPYRAAGDPHGLAHRRVDADGRRGPAHRAVRHRPRAVRRRTRRRSTARSSPIWWSRSIAYFVARVQIMVVGRIGEGFLRDLRMRVFDHLQSLSLAFYDREKAGVLVSRMTSDVDSMAELVQFGLLQFVIERLAARRSRSSCSCVVSWQLTLVCLISVPIVAIASASSSSATRTRRTSPSATASATTCRRCRRASPASGHPGVRPRAGSEVDRFAESNRYALRRPHGLGAHLGVVPPGHRVRRHRARPRAVVGIGGWLVHQGEVSLGTVAFFVLTLSNLFEPVQQLSQLFNTVQAAGAGLNKLFEPARHPSRRARAAGARSTCPTTARSGRRQRLVLLRRR